MIYIFHLILSIYDIDNLLYYIIIRAYLIETFAISYVFFFYKLIYDHLFTNELYK